MNKKETIIYTDEQKKIIETDINKNILVKSDAGCGKTFCIVERIKFLVKQGVNQNSILVLTFNKDIAAEIAKKLHHSNLYSVTSQTLDSFVFDSILGIKNTKPPLFTRSKHHKEKIDKFYITFDTSKQVFIENFNEIKKRLKFTHILIDECQDMVNQKFKIVKLLKNSNIKIFCCGDNKQKINGFSELNVEIYDPNDNAIWELFNKPNDITLKLTTSFRTNNFLLKELNKIYDTNTTSNIKDDNYMLNKIDVIYDKNNIDKKNAEYITIVDYYKKIYNKYPNNSIKILCRKSRDVSKINSMLSDVIRNENDEVKSFVKDFMVECLHRSEKNHWYFNYYDAKEYLKTLEKGELKNELYKLVSMAGKIRQRVESENNDHFEYINYFDYFDWKINSQTEKEVEDLLIDYFQSKISNIKTFYPATTIHKSKGQEWPIVILFFNNFSKKNSIEEEKNLFYVGCTRAKKVLTIIDDNRKENNILHNNIKTMLFSKSDKNIFIDPNDREYLSITTTIEANLCLDLFIHSATGYGDTLHALIRKYVHSNFKAKFDDIYQYCDYFVFCKGSIKYKDSLKKAFNKITKLIDKKHKDGWEIISEYSLYLVNDKSGKTIKSKIDLLYKKGNKIEIIDFKSSSTKEIELTQAYINQIELYREAISKRYNNANIDCKFYIYDKTTHDLFVCDVTQKNFCNI